MGQGSNADEWEIERLDLDAYLRRVGHHGDTAPTARTFAALHRAHLAAIPFENVSTFERSPFVGKPVVVRRDEESIRSLVDRRLTLERPDGTLDERDVADDEIGGLLRETFGIPLNDDEVAQLTFASRTPG